jgi:hypothetical protein
MESVSLPPRPLRPSSLERFVEVRERLLSRGARDERVINFGDHPNLLATDPEGGMLEVVVESEPDADLPSQSRRPAHDREGREHAARRHQNIWTGLGAAAKC